MRPEPCESCHSKIPSDKDAQEESYFLLKKSIDATCHICHEYAREPKQLSLHKRYITCNTCHLHRKPEGQDYKLVRLVKISNKKIDWSEFCVDCHANS